MHKIVITGSGTGVGKTVVSAILTTLLKADYWKPIECGEDEGFDSQIMKNLIDLSKHVIHAPAYSLKAPLSPHHAARLENCEIDPSRIEIPPTKRSLIIETAGGPLVPLTNHFVTLDLFSTWNCYWIIVSKHYLGSINHTLLTHEVLKNKNLPVLGMIFNGEPNQDTEDALMQISGLPFLGRLLPEKDINIKTIQHYAGLWQAQILQKLRN